MTDTAVKKERVGNATFHDNKGDLFASYDVNDFEVPQGRDEVWRFVSLRRLRGLHNGKFAEQTDAQIEVNAPSEVTVEEAQRDDERLKAVAAPTDRIAAQAWTSMPNATVVTVPAKAELSEPIVITTTGAGDDATSFAGIHVEVGESATATIIVQYTGSGTHADNVNFVIGDNAHVNVIVDEEWNNDAVHVGAQSIVVGRDAVLRHTVATFGGEVVRNTPRVKYAGSGGDVELIGVYYADDGQYIENRLLVDHNHPYCRSNVLYKGALQGDKDSKLPDARTCWVGDVLIRSNASGTETYEANRNIVLTDGARADAIPNLEIETGDIPGAGHAATVGRFDEEQLFYLKSRGIPDGEARRLIVRGFFNEVLNRIPVESVREELINRVSGELEQVNL
ncbi:MULTISPECIES: Fe-S cluster assembly protein SufD [unclassified Corynebacterium]|uniref:Fe-S cluster assembly protein SufD n=1 Tax=unclassified Corynebacterium TaxID=2624378 RepID=UPI0021AA2418|nr:MULTISPECIES: Fe-S cluster assembly protein SufD [unclassified Corynebacterium]MCT1452411.1 Fe-S cluster assembly protein SufD [Corynebacterium sp. p3-SID1145]MCT1461193.1 Fe-S cluster assembly protein SufD [Corynebacterium sp. p3-SID1140]MDN8593942.1 Fe-S cluster assembly protein SufD [Corynebacterium sp. P4_F2]WKK56042.1 Fe-S cluster assembly protein SufD [Corynebacterium sp. P4-C1]WKK63451.1 Fe-S cluster assembly protein SufD [Corynebacterium sp. P8-C1]